VTTANIHWDRLAILEIGARRLALPLSDVVYFAQAGEQQAVSDGPRWMVGILAQRAGDAGIPVLDLAGLWDDVSLRGSRSRIVATLAGIGIAIDSYTTTQVAIPILPLRPAPGMPALRRAALIDGRPIPVLDARHLVSHDQWEALKLTA